MESLVVISNNLSKIFAAMAANYEGQVVSLIGRDGCGCTPAQILAAINANLIEFGRTYTGGGGGGGSGLTTLVAMPDDTGDPGAEGEYAVDEDRLAIYVPGTGWMFFQGFQLP